MRGASRRHQQTRLVRIRSLPDSEQPVRKVCSTVRPPTTSVVSVQGHSGAAVPSPGPAIGVSSSGLLETRRATKLTRTMPSKPYEGVCTLDADTPGVRDAVARLHRRDARAGSASSARLALLLLGAGSHFLLDLFRLDRRGRRRRCCGRSSHTASASRASISAPIAGPQSFCQRSQGSSGTRTRRSSYRAGRRTAS